MIALWQDGFPSLHPEHNILYSHGIIWRCPDCALCWFEDFDHDCFPTDEAWDRTRIYRLSREDSDDLERAVSQCPAPRMQDCTCHVHVALSKSARALPRIPLSEVLPGVATAPLTGWGNATLQLTPEGPVLIPVKDA